MNDDPLKTYFADDKESERVEVSPALHARILKEAASAPPAPRLHLFPRLVTAAAAVLLLGFFLLPESKPPEQIPGEVLVGLDTLTQTLTQGTTVPRLESRLGEPYQQEADAIRRDLSRAGAYLRALGPVESLVPASPLPSSS